MNASKTPHTPSKQIRLNVASFQFLNANHNTGNVRQLIGTAIFQKSDSNARSKAGAKDSQPANSICGRFVESEKSAKSTESIDAFNCRRISFMSSEVQDEPLLNPIESASLEQPDGSNPAPWRDLPMPILTDPTPTAIQGFQVETAPLSGSIQRPDPKF